MTDDSVWTYDGGLPPAEYESFDYANPPVFESQAAFLRRLGLLLPGELRRLKASDFEPEAVDIAGPEAVSPYR